MDAFIEGFTKVVDLVVQYTGYAAIGFEVILRIWPSDNVRSVFSYAGKILHKTGDLCFALNDALNTVVQDKPSPDEE